MAERHNQTPSSHISGTHPVSKEQLLTTLQYSSNIYCTLCQQFWCWCTLWFPVLQIPLAGTRGKQLRTPHPPLQSRHFTDPGTPHPTGVRNWPTSCTYRAAVHHYLIFCHLYDIYTSTACLRANLEVFLCSHTLSNRYNIHVSSSNQAWPLGARLHRPICR